MVAAGVRALRVFTNHEPGSVWMCAGEVRDLHRIIPLGRVVQRQFFIFLLTLGIFFFFLSNASVEPHAGLKPLTLRSRPSGVLKPDIQPPEPPRRPYGQDF